MTDRRLVRRMLPWLMNRPFPVLASTGVLASLGFWLALGCRGQLVRGPGPHDSRAGADPGHERG